MTQWRLLQSSLRLCGNPAMIGESIEVKRVMEARETEVKEVEVREVTRAKEAREANRAKEEREVKAGVEYSS